MLSLEDRSTDQRFNDLTVQHSDAIHRISLPKNGTVEIFTDLNSQTSSRWFPWTLNVDRDQLPQRLPESTSPGCFRHLQDAPSALSRPTTQVAFPSRDPVPFLSEALPNPTQRPSVPRAREPGRDHLVEHVRHCARSHVPAPRSSSASQFLILRFHERFFPERAVVYS
jgi:hypothetical protein